MPANTDPTFHRAPTDTIACPDPPAPPRPGTPTVDSLDLQPVPGKASPSLAYVS